MDGFGGMLEHEIPRMRRYARALLHNHVDADDLVHDAVVRALSRVHLWREGSDLRAWLFTILHNQYVNDIRKSSRMGVPVPIEKIAGVGLPASQQTTIELNELNHVLRYLPEKQRSVLALIALEGMNHEQVAKLFRIPVGTVRSRLSRARRRLRALLDVAEERPAASPSRGATPRHRAAPRSSAA